LGDAGAQQSSLAASSAAKGIVRSSMQRVGGMFLMPRSVFHPTGKAVRWRTNPLRCVFQAVMPKFFCHTRNRHFIKYKLKSKFYEQKNLVKNSFDSRRRRRGGSKGDQTSECFLRPDARVVPGIQRRVREVLEGENRR